MIRRVLFYGMASACSRLAAIVLVPLYVSRLSMEELGDLELLLSIHALMVLLGGLQSESAILRYFYEPYQLDRPKGNGWNAILLSIVGCATTCGLILLGAFLGWLPPSMSNRAILFPLMGLVLPTQLLGVQLVILRCRDSVRHFAFVSISDLVLGLALSALFVVSLKMGVEGALLGLLCSKLILVSIAWPWTFGLPSGQCLRWTALKRMAAYGIPALPAVFVGWVQNAGNRVVLAALLGLDDVALAGVAIKVSSIFGMLVYSFRLAWEPYAMSSLTASIKDSVRYDREMTWYLACMFVVMGLAVIVAPVITLILTTPAYASAGSLAVLFIAAQFWVGLLSLTSIGIHGASRTKMLIPVTAGGAIINVGLLLILAPWIGVFAAGVGFLAGSVFSAVLAAHFSNRLYGTGFSMQPLAWCFGATIAFSSGWIYVTDRFQQATQEISSMLAVAAGTLFILGCISVVLILFGLPRRHIKDGLSVLRSAFTANRKKV